MPDHRPFAFAGLWERWNGGPTIESCTVITTAANRALSRLHDRMPVVVAPYDYALWLNPAVTDLGAVEHLLASPANDDLVANPVSTRVNNVRNNDSQCVQPVSLDSRATEIREPPRLF
jgi:putative SOS response-associated peptidase YedK